MAVVPPNKNVPRPKGNTILVVVVLLLGLIVFLNSYQVIEPDERGVAVRLGEITSDEPIQPGFHWKVPFLTSIETFSIVPKTYEVTFTVGDDGAITKDMQTLGATVVVRYNYDENPNLLLPAFFPCECNFSIYHCNRRILRHEVFYL